MALMIVIFVVFLMQDSHQADAGVAVSCSPSTAYAAQDLSNPAGEDLGMEEAATQPAAQGVALEPPAEDINSEARGWDPRTALNDQQRHESTGMYSYLSD